MFARSFDGVKIYYRVHRGSRGWLVFLHGWAVNWTSWKRTVEFFDKLGYSTIALDFRGHGWSGKPRGRERYRLRYLVEDVYAVLKKEGVADAVLVGSSMGGIIAVMYQDAHPKRVGALVLANTTDKMGAASFVRFFPLLEFLSDYLIDHGFVASNRLPYMRDVDLSRLHNRPDVLILLKSMVNLPLLGAYAVLKPLLSVNVEDMLSDIEVPVLIVSSEKDQFFRQEIADFMHRKIRKSKLVSFPGTHSLIVKNPSAVSGAILDFVRELEKESN